MSFDSYRHAGRFHRFAGTCLVLAAAAILAGCMSGGPMLARDNGSSGATSAAAAGPAINVSVDVTKPHQTLIGFGAATAYYQNWLTIHPGKQAIYAALFRGLKLDILRLPNLYRPEKGPDFARDDAEIVRAAQASLGHPVTIMMSSWSPPAALKSNHSEKNGGTLAQNDAGAFEYDKFGQYWYDALVAYRKIGIVPTYVSIQNEPDWKAEWETCRFQPMEQEQDGRLYAGYDRAFDAVYSKVSRLRGAPKLIGPETLGISDGKPQTYLDPIRDKKRMGHVYGIAHHLYNGGTHLEPDSFLPRFHSIRDSYPDKPRMMTEFGRSNGFQTAWLIQNSLTEEDASSYVYWAAVWPGDDCLITIDNPYQKSGWKLPNGYRLNDRYFALKHFSYLLGPGYRRVETAAGDPSLKTSAFLSPKQDWLIVILLNTSDNQEKSVALNLKGFTRGGAGKVYRSVFPLAEKAEMPEQFKDLGDFGADNRIALPPHSLVTVSVNAR